MSKIKMISIIGAVSLILSACGSSSKVNNDESKPKFTIKDPEEVKKDDLPDVEGVEKQKDLVNNTEVRAAKELQEAVQVGKEKVIRDEYLVNTTIACGNLKSKCVIKSPQDLKPPKNKLINIKKWPIKNPIIHPKPQTYFSRRGSMKELKGEEDYYAIITNEPSQWLYVRQYDKVNNWHTVSDAVLILHDLWEGPLPLLEGDILASSASAGRHRDGITVKGSYHGNGNTVNVTFTSRKRKILVHNNDWFPEEFIFKDPLGKIIKQEKLAAYDSKDQKTFHWYHGITQRMIDGPQVKSPILEMAGIYTIESARCPWKICYIHVLKNPYAKISDDGSFNFKKVPVGKYKLEVWHQSLKPKQRYYDFEIEARGSTTKILIEFELPTDKK
ncbi:MAG: hypothetical protein COA79_14835 [Planctomycetota bacterium]|nr:MAG: hypothetical protein COA79_14835 [Planctomycetota bacterium]